MAKKHHRAKLVIKIVGSHERDKEILPFLPVFLITCCLFLISLITLRLCHSRDNGLAVVCPTGNSMRNLNAIRNLRLKYFYINSCRWFSGTEKWIFPSSAHDHQQPQRLCPCLGSCWLQNLIKGRQSRCEKSRKRHAFKEKITTVVPRGCIN